MIKKIIFVLLVFMNIYTGFLVANQKEKCIEITNELLDIDKKNKESINYIAKAFSIQINSIGNKIQEETTLIDVNQVKHSISQVFDKGYKLCFRFYTNDCESCIDTQLMNLEDISNKIGSEKIIVICDYTEDKLKWLDHKFNSKFECYRLISNNNTLGLNIEKDKIPYYFISSNSLEPMFIFPIIEKKTYFIESFYERVINVVSGNKK